MNVHIDIDTRTFVRFWLVVIGFALAALLIYSARTALTIIGIAFFLAIALSPPVNRLAKILPSKSRILSTAVAYLVVVLFLGAVVVLVIPPIVEQTIRFIQTFPALVESATHQSTGLTRFITDYNLQPEVDKVVMNLRDGVTNFASGIGSVLITSIGSLLEMMTSFILVLVLTFLMLVEGPTWLDRLWGLYRNKKRMQHHRHLATHMYNMVTSYVTGQLTVSSIAGTVAGTAVFVLSLFLNAPASLAIPSAAIIFVFSLIPLFGAMLGAVFVSVVLMLSNITAAIVFLVFFIIYQQIEANYIHPVIQSKRVAIPALAVLIAITIGIYMFGIAGAIVSIPVAGCIKVLFDDYRERIKVSAPVGTHKE
ncbi:AI-2E family transporter [Candidatus Saccharibacteria bacterium]|nr:AI-2E family transporter [Candidatus Saccharibacteria bacterium]